MASLEEVQKLRETLLDRMAKRGNPGLLPCGVNECAVDDKPTYHEPHDVEFAEPSEIRDRTGVTIDTVKDKRLITVCRSCGEWLRRMELFRD
jgi:hypothetical protein